MRKFDNFIDAFMEYTQYVEAPERYLRWSAYSIISGALERRTWIRVKGEVNCYPNQFIMLVGPPGLVRKSSSSRKAIALLKHIKKLRFLATQFTGAAFILQLVSAADGSEERVFHHEGESFPNSSLYAYSSEAVNTLKDSEGAIIQLLTDLYDCGQIDEWSNEIPGFHKQTKGDGAIEVYNPCVNFLGCSTPEWLVRSIGKDDLKGGFASRVIFVVETTRPDRQHKWADEDDREDTGHMRKDLIRDLTEIAHMQGEYKTTLGFRKLFDDFDESIKVHLEQNPNDSMYGYHARKAWHSLKLSQAVSASKSNEMILEKESLETAIDLLEDIEKGMRKAFGKAGMSSENQILAEMVDYLDSFKGTVITKRKICMDNKNYNQDQILKALHVLKEENSILVRYQGQKLVYYVPESFNADS